MSEPHLSHARLLEPTSEIVSAHVSNNPTPIADVQCTIETVYTKLSGLGAPGEAPEEPPKPTAPIRKSFADNHIDCLEDGTKHRMLKRHLAAAHRLTPE